MIHIVIKRQDQRYSQIEVSGHAGYEDEGKDIVCAGISALLGGMLNGLEFFLGDEFVYHVDPKGHAKVVLAGTMSDELYEIAYTIIKTFELGVRMVHQDYPDYVIIHKEEVDRDD